MKITSTHIFTGVVVIGVVLFVGSRLISAPAKPQADTGVVAPGKFIELAKCIKDSGAKFYGAFWCPHCHEQKLLFGDAVPELPYIECSNPDKQSQTQVCIDAKITGYPTWEFKDGSRLNGVVSLEKLAEQTSCTIPK